MECLIVKRKCVQSHNEQKNLKKSEVTKSKKLQSNQKRYLSWLNHEHCGAGSHYPLHGPCSRVTFFYACKCDQGPWTGTHEHVRVLTCTGIVNSTHLRGLCWRKAFCNNSYSASLCVAYLGGQWWRVVWPKRCPCSWLSTRVVCTDLSLQKSPLNPRLTRRRTLHLQKNVMLILRIYYWDLAQTCKAYIFWLGWPPILAVWEMFHWIAPVVICLINFSINDGQIPDIWWTVIVTPISKVA